MLSDEGGDLTFGVATVQAPRCMGIDAELSVNCASSSNSPRRTTRNIVEFLWIDENILVEKPAWTTIRANRQLFF